MVLAAQYGTARWHWAPSMAGPGRQDWLPSMAQLDRTGCPVWHGLIGLGVDWAPCLARSPSPLAHQFPQNRAQDTSQAQPVEPQLYGNQGVPRVSHPGTSMFPGVSCARTGVSQGCYVPSRVGLSPGVSHPNTRVSSGMFHPRANMSQDCHTPGRGFPRSVTSHTGMSGWGPWRW